jgi:hypothetical protein
MTALFQLPGRSPERRRRMAGWLASIHLLFFLVLPAAHFVGHGHTNDSLHGALAGQGCAVCQALAHNGALLAPPAHAPREAAAPRAALPATPAEAPAPAASVAAHGPRAPPLA